MLNELHIKDFAIIDELTLNFIDGLVVFTGETGAGKSIILDAVEAVLGGRTDTTFVRSGAEVALVEAVFTIPEDGDSLRQILVREELLEDPHTLTLSREVRANGRTVARANGRSIAVSLLREIGETLVDLHGQSEHLSLLRTAEHLPLLDRFAGAFTTRQEYAKTYREWLDIRRQLSELRQTAQDAARKAELLQYQLEEIQSARLQVGEDLTLRTERDRLANAEGLASLAQEALQAMEEGAQEAPSASDLIGQAVHALGRLARLDASQNGLFSEAELLLEKLTGLNRSLRDYLEAIEFNPKRLDQVEERLNLIHGLQRKYGETIPDILAHGGKARADLESITTAGEREAELVDLENGILLRLAEQGQALSVQRRAAAERLSEAIQMELNDLKMNGARFTVDFQQRPDAQGILLAGGERIAFDENGLESVEFLIAPNPGEGFKPLVKIASGGETSRLMLALKNVLARADHIPTLIFDEIDQGIGGRVGSVVGQKLWHLGRAHQVFCITHLPQLAAYGDQHYQVQKNLADGRTTTQVKPLQGDDRILELAQMLGDVSEGTLHSAFELLQAAAAAGKEAGG